MKIVANDNQQYVCNKAMDWWFNRPHDKLFQFEGPPGTGKSWLLHQMLKAFNIDPTRVAPTAYTGAASTVLRTKGFFNAKTEHAWLYKPNIETLYDKNGDVVINDYFNIPVSYNGFTPKALDNIDLMIIDESPMTPEYIRKEIDSRDVRVIACGDLKQLPPVGSNPGYLVDGEIFHLNQIMRQNADNPIIWISNRAYENKPIHKGLYRSNSGSVLVIEEDELTDNMIAWADIMICGTNKTRDKMNTRTRQSVLGIKSDLPLYNERLVCRRNNWNREVDGISLTNGLVGRVSSYPDVSCFDGKTLSISFNPFIINSSFNNLKINYEYLTAPYDKRKIIKENKYYEGERFEYAYCVTTHVSQGSEYNNGIYFKEYLSKEINPNLDFTGITRFKRSCIIVLPKRKFYLR